MVEKQIDLRYIDAKNDLVNFINGMPKKYNLSFIFIDNILNDIKAQVEKAATNDYNALINMYASQVALNQDTSKNTFNDNNAVEEIKEDK